MERGSIVNRHWLMVLLGGFCEIGWVAGLKYASAWWEWLLTAGALLASFYLLVAAANGLPAGTAYAVFTGIGAAGTAVAETVLFGEPFQPGKMALVLLMVIGIAGLKLTTDADEKRKEET
jgi:paired small multidrug resistance pump